jgi:hypothetical protein
MSRTGKIARLPSRIRHLLNRRLDDGEQGKDLVLWLNALDEVKTLLTADFGGRPISEQNLSEWKQGGFLDWQRQQDTSADLRELVEFSEELSCVPGDPSVADRIAAVFAAELAVETRKLLRQTADPAQRCQLLCQAISSIRLLRDGDYKSSRERRQSERWEFERDDLEWEQEKARMAEARDYEMAPIAAAQKRQTMLAVSKMVPGGAELMEARLDADRKYKAYRYFTPNPDPSPPPPDPT